jgi:hypothetical protein
MKTVLGIALAVILVVGVLTALGARRVRRREGRAGFEALSNDVTAAGAIGGTHHNHHHHHAGSDAGSHHGHSGGFDSGHGGGFDGGGGHAGGGSH